MVCWRYGPISFHLGWKGSCLPVICPQDPLPSLQDVVHFIHHWSLSVMSMTQSAICSSKFGLMTKRFPWHFLWWYWNLWIQRYLQIHLCRSQYFSWPFLWPKFTHFSYQFLLFLHPYKYTQRLICQHMFQSSTSTYHTSILIMKGMNQPNQSKLVIEGLALAKFRGAGVMNYSAQCINWNNNLYLLKHGLWKNWGHWLANGLFYEQLLQNKMKVIVALTVFFFIHSCCSWTTISRTTLLLFILWIESIHSMILSWHHWEQKFNGPAALLWHLHLLCTYSFVASVDYIVSLNVDYSN